MRPVQWVLFPLAIWGSIAASARAQDDQPAAPPHPRVITPNGEVMSPRAIDDDYNRQLLGLERQRLERLAKLASRQPAKDASATYEQIFRLAVANNLFSEAEPVADQVIRSADSSPTVRFLAHLVDLVATADRGAFDESLATLRGILGEAKKASRPGPPALDSALLLDLCEAYYQRLVQASQLSAARNAFELLAKETTNPAVKGYCTNRLHRLEQVGKPAPPLEGTDLDGKRVKLADLKGKVVLIDFWASWCLPSAEELDWLGQVHADQSARGFQIIGVNLDAAAEGATHDSITPNVRRFVLDHNVRWPVLINGPGAGDVAKAFAIADIPANVLIGRDGKVIHLDLTRRNLAEVVARACAP